MTDTDGDTAVDTQSWIFDLADVQRLAPKSRSVVQILASQPRLSSYSSAGIIAEAAGVNVATVIRTAQALGFSGWPGLRAEVRARYLAALSLPEVAAEHAAASTSAFSASVNQDAESLAHLSRHVRSDDVVGVVDTIVSSDRTLVVAQGSFEAVGHALVHNAMLAGYRLDLAGGGSAPTDMLNALAQLRPGDALLAVSLWRQYDRTIRAAQVGKEQGATVCAITDSTGTALWNVADHRILVSAESASFFPSLTGALAVAQGVCAELAARDPERTKANVERSESLWDRFGVLHVNRRPGKGGT